LKTEKTMEGNMTKEKFQKVYRPQPSPLYEKLKDLKITAGTVARYLGKSYTYTLNQLNGVSPMQPATEQKLNELIKMFEQET